MEKSKGIVTIPTDLDVVPQTLELMKPWGADAIRDCDGTDFPTELKDADVKCLVIWECSIKKMGKNPEFCSEILSEITEFFKSQNLYMEL